MVTPLGLIVKDSEIDHIRNPKSKILLRALCQQGRYLWALSMTEKRHLCLDLKTHPGSIATGYDEAEHSNREGEMGQRRSAHGMQEGEDNTKKDPGHT